MLKSLFRLSLIVITGTFLKPRIKGLLILLVFCLTVWFLQAEYLSYVDYSGDTRFVLLVSLTKVGLILFSLFIYALVIERKIFLNKKLSGKRKGVRTTIDNYTKINDKDDGFDFIRHKKKLRGKPEQLLDK